MIGQQVAGAGHFAPDAPGAQNARTLFTEPAATGLRTFARCRDADDQAGPLAAVLMFPNVRIMNEEHQRMKSKQQGIPQ
jgi:hypothetical protein